MNAKVNKMNLMNIVNERLINEDAEESKVYKLSKPSFEMFAEVIGCKVKELQVAGLEEVAKIVKNVDLNEYDVKMIQILDYMSRQKSMGILLKLKELESDIKVYMLHKKVHIVITDRTYGYTRIFSK